MGVGQMNGFLAVEDYERLIISEEYPSSHLYLSVRLVSSFIDSLHPARPTRNVIIGSISEQSVIIS